MRKEMLVFGSPVIEIAEIEDVVCLMESGLLGTDPKAAIFEQNFGEQASTDFEIMLRRWNC